MRYIRYKKQIGFTLLELMIVMVIAGVLLSIGVPAYQVMRNNNCLVTNTNRLVATLQYARSEAAKRNTTVSVRARAGSWRFGFEIITDEIDADGDGQCTGIEDHDNSITRTGGNPPGGACELGGILKVIELGCWDTDPTKGLQISHDTVSDVTGQLFTYSSSGRIGALALGGVFNTCMAGFLGADRGRQTRVSSIGRPQTNSIDITACPF